ncbi:unnamed protein product [Rhizophagus irregularis]|nr:unnamed protein product [Rhizophagus irregularis]CAB5388697.1 unnamed protein product [Rhizophagus irregularis]
MSLEIIGYCVKVLLKYFIRQFLRNFNKRIFTGFFVKARIQCEDPATTIKSLNISGPSLNPFFFTIVIGM